MEEEERSERKLTLCGQRERVVLDECCVPDSEYVGVGQAGLLRENMQMCVGD